MPYSPINDYSGELGSTHGLHLDQDFAAISSELKLIRALLASIQRDDGRIRNGRVTFDTLSQEVRALLSFVGDKYQGPWQSGLMLRIGDLCSGAAGLYLATGTFYAGASLDEDIAAERLVFMNGGGSGSGSGIVEVIALPPSPEFVDGAKLVLMDGVAYVWNGESWAALVSGSPAGVPSVLELPASPDEVDGAQIVRKIPENVLYGWTGPLTGWKRPSINGDDLVDGTIPAEKLYSIDLRAIVGNIGELNAGSMTMDAQGYLRGGQTGFNTGSGFWMGYNVDQYVLSLGNANADRLLFDRTGTRIDGSLTIGSTAEVQMITNVALANLAGWYDGNGQPSLPPQVYTVSGAMVLDLTGGPPFDISVASQKFAVAGGEVLRVSALLNVTDSVGGDQIVFTVLFSNNPLLEAACVHRGNAVGDSADILFGADAIDYIRPSPGDFSPVTGTVVVPAGMVWASVVIEGAAA